MSDWRSGRENLAYYFTKLHAKVHHKVTQPLYVINSLASRGCTTLIITDNECCESILNNTVKQRRSKAMDMQFYWIKCRIAQGQFKLLWRSGRENLADYFTKLQAQVHHKITRPLYVINLLASRGCNKGVFIGANIPYLPLILTTSNRTRHEHIGTQTMIALTNARTRL